MKIKKILAVLICALTASALYASGEGGPSYPNFGLPRVEEMMFLVLQIGIIIFAARLGDGAQVAQHHVGITGHKSRQIAAGAVAFKMLGDLDHLFHRHARSVEVDTAVAVYLKIDP